MKEFTAKLKSKVLVGIIISMLVLAGALLLPPLIQTAQAATSGEYEYAVNEDGTTATITGYTGAGEDIIIPDTVTDGTNTYTVIAIGDSAFASKSAITSILIPKSVISIGASAFSGCTMLRKACFLGNVPTTGDNIFSECGTDFAIYYTSASAGFSDPWICYPASVFNPDVTYTVTFDLNGETGTSPDVQTIYEGVKAVCPDDPTCQGKKFGGWYTEFSCANAWSFNTPLTADIILYAKWTIDKVAVTFDSQGGSAVASIEVDYNTTISEPTVPTWKGYSFGGWYTNAECTVEWNFALDHVTSDVTLYAKWTIMIYSDSGVIEKEDFTPLDMAASPDGTAIYITGTNNCFVYRYDVSTGDVTALSTPYPARKLSFSTDGVLLVTLSNPASKVDTVGLIEMSTFSLTDTFNVSLNYSNEYLTGVKADSSYIYAYSDHGIYLYNRSEYEYLSFCNVSYDDVEINPLSGHVYATRSGQTVSFKVSDGKLISIKYNLHDGSDGPMTIMPDGQHLLLSDGTILTCSETASEDLVYVTSLKKVNVVSINPAANELYISYNRIINVYDASDLSFIRTMAEPAVVDYMMCGNGMLTIGAENTDGDIIMHSIRVDALLESLQINGEPFTEFYPTYLNMDRGEVPNSIENVNIKAVAANADSVVSGDTDVQPLVIGENTFQVTVTNSQTGHTETYTITFTRLETDPEPTSYNGLSNLGFTPNDMVFDPDKNAAYMTASNGHSLYRIDLVTGEIQEKQFDIYADKLILADGKIYVTLKRSTIHANLNDGFNYAGAIAVVNTSTFSIEYIFEVYLSALDIESDDSGQVYISCSDGMNTLLSSYNSSNGQFASEHYSTHSCHYIDINNMKNKVYGVTLGSSPMEIEAFDITDEEVSGNYDSPYHGDYDITSYMQVSPDGRFIFNGSGNIFTCTSSKTGDMVYDGRIGGYTSICFNPDNGKFYTSGSYTLNVYDYQTRSLLYTRKSSDTFIKIFHDGNGIAALQKNSSGVYYIRRIRTEQNINLSGLSVSEGTLSSSFDPATTTYCLVLGAQTSQVTITPTPADNTSTMTIGGTAAISKTVSLDPGCWMNVSIVVTSGDGLFTRTYTVKIYRETSDDTFVMNGSCFVPSAKVIDPDCAAVYMIGTNEPFVYRAGEDGSLSVLRLPGVACSLGFSGDVLAVSIKNAAFDYYAVGLIDPLTFLLTELFEVDAGYTGFAGDAKNIYAYNEDGIYVYSKTGFEQTSSILINTVYNVIINEVTGKLYVTSYWNIGSYTVNNGVITRAKEISSFQVSGFTIMPDSEHLVLSNGNIYSCSAVNTQDLVLTSTINKDDQILGTASSTNELFIANNCVVYVFDASDFSYKRFITETAAVEYMMYSDGVMFLAQKNEDGHMVLRTVYPSALLKSLTVDTEPSSEFYTTQTNVYWGEVPYASASVNITAIAAQDDAMVSGDIGVQVLSTGANELTITVTDPQSGLSEAYTVYITRRSSDPVSTYNAFTNLGFTPLDMALDPDRAVAYMTAKDSYNLYRIDLETGAIQKKTFALKIEHIAVANGKIFVTLPRHEHTGYVYAAEFGAVAILDATTFKIENIFDVCIDPFDIEADSDGNVYISPGSGQSSVIAQYDSSTGRHVKDIQTIYMQGYIDSNPKMNRLYYFDTLITPRGMSAIEIIDGVYTSKYDWPYGWENYNIAKYSCVSSDGLYIFNGSGNVFTCSTTKADDMHYDGNIGTTFTSICFDISKNYFYTANGNTLTVFEYDNRTAVDTLVSSDTFISLQHDGEKIVALQKDSSGRYYINQDLFATTNADLANITLSKGTLSPGFNHDATEYDVSIPNAYTSTTITPITADRDATIYIDGVETTSKSVTLGGGETCDVVITVTAEDETTQKTYTLHISREPNSSNANLSGITLSVGTLLPVFDASTTEYSVNLTNTASGIWITPTKADITARLTIDDALLSSKYLSLSVGVTKDVVIQVTAQDGITRKIYTLHITRFASSNANLSGITLSTGSLSPDFESNTAEYSVILPSTQSSIKITPVRADSTALIKIGGVSTNSTTISLMGGQSEDIVITVTAQDNSTVKEYTIHIYREAIAVIKVTISQSNVEMICGTSENLAISIFPSDATYPEATWSSSDEDVVTVDQTGKVTAVSAGKATITVTADGLSDTCEVIVEPATYNIAVIANNAVYGAVTGGGTYGKDASATLTATPKTGYRFVRWTSGATQLSTSAQYTLTASGNQSITAEFAPIGVPTLYAASAGYNSARLAWTAVEGAAGYEVWRSTSAGGSYVKLGSTSETNYLDYVLSTNTPYYYKVNAYCTASTATTYGSQSVYASATPVPAAATVYALPTNYNSAYVSWNAVPGASGYELSRSTSQNSGYSVVKTTSSLSYTNTSLNTGTTYYYRVRAYRTVGKTKAWGDYSPITSATPALSSVTSASASAYYPTSIKVSWSAVPGRTKYEVLRSDSATGTYTRIGSTTSTYYKDTICIPFVTYYYQIKVYRTVNRQPIYSASASPTASAIPILGNVSGVKAAVSSPSSVKISWASVTGASGYEVLRSATIDGVYVPIKSTTSRSFTDTSCTPNTTYYYQVRAYRKAGGGTVPSAPSAAISATPYFGSVSNAKAVRSSAGRIKLTWSAVSGRMGYEIYRRSSPDSDFVLIKNTTSTSFTDSGLTAGVTYEYKIVAYRTVNGVKCRSTESVVSATP